MAEEQINLTKIGKHRIIEKFNPHPKLKVVWITEAIIAYILITASGIGFIGFVVGVGGTSLPLRNILTIGVPWYFGISLPLLLLILIFIWVYRQNLLR